MRARCEVARVFVVDRRRPSARQDDCGVEHLGDRTRRRLEQLVDVAVFGEEGDAQRPIGVVRDSVGVDDGDAVQARLGKVEAIERQVQAVLHARGKG